MIIKKFYIQVIYYIISLILITIGLFFLIRIFSPNQILTLRFLYALFFFYLGMRLITPEIGSLNENLAFFASNSLKYKPIYQNYNFLLTSTGLVLKIPDNYTKDPFLVSEPTVYIFSFFSKPRILIETKNIRNIYIHTFLGLTKEPKNKYTSTQKILSRGISSQQISYNNNGIDIHITAYLSIIQFLIDPPSIVNV